VNLKKKFTNFSIGQFLMRSKVLYQILV